MYDMYAGQVADEVVVSFRAEGAANAAGPLEGMLRREREIARAVVARTWHDLMAPKTRSQIKQDAVFCVRRGSLDRWLRACSEGEDGFQHRKAIMLQAADIADDLLHAGRNKTHAPTAAMA